MVPPGSRHYFRFRGCRTSRGDAPCVNLIKHRFLPGLSTKTSLDTVVLGRPGSGCSTFLKTLANHRGDYYDVLGDVFYDSLVSEEIDKRYRGDVIYCPEDDVHFPTLKVGETLKFASTMRTPSRRADNQSRYAHATLTAESLMRIFGLEHARDTVVGDASLRGISGGEKKRVSLAEAMSARGKLVCWDKYVSFHLHRITTFSIWIHPVQHVDWIRPRRSSSSKHFASRPIPAISRPSSQSIKPESSFSTCLIKYASSTRERWHTLGLRMRQNGISQIWGTNRRIGKRLQISWWRVRLDTVMVFVCSSSHAATDPHGRKIRPGFQGVIPRTADEMAAYFRTSAYGQLNRSSIDSYYNLYVNKADLKRAYDASATGERARHAPNNQSYTLSIPMQVRAVMRRRWQILKGDWTTQAVQLGSVFHRPDSPCLLDTDLT